MVDVGSVKELVDYIRYYQQLLSLWPESIQRDHAKKEVDAYSCLALNQVNGSKVTDLKSKIQNLVNSYFLELKVDPQKLVFEWIKRAKECQRTPCVGRFWPGGEYPEKYYGHNITIKEPRGYTNLLNMITEYDSYFVPSELEKIRPAPLENMARFVLGYTLIIDETPRLNFRSDY